jgi:hypothetical protein
MRTARRYSELSPRSCGRGRTHSSKGGRRSSPAAERVASPVICCQASPGCALCGGGLASQSRTHGQQVVNPDVTRTQAASTLCN